MNDAIATINEVMNQLPPSALGYEEWLQVGMALHAEGGNCADWEAWSRNDTRFVSGECERKWSGFGRHGQSEIKCGSIVEMARRHGIDVSPKHVDDSEPDTPLDWTSPIEDVKAQRVIRPEYVVQAIIPDKKNWNPIGDLMSYIRALFRDGEKFSVCMSATKKEQADGSVRYHPSSSGNVLDVDKTLESLDKQAALKDDGDITNVLGPYIKEAGAWVRINPVIGDEGDDRSVSAWRHALVECDRKSPEEQLAIIREMNLPCAAIIHSGGKSIHAIVKVNANTADEYTKRVDFLFKMCEKNGLPLDKQNRNPSRYSRLPGVMRNGNRQFLIAVDCGARNWQQWETQQNEKDNPLPFCDAGEWLGNPEPATEQIISSWLDAGDIGYIVGPSKIGKTFFTLQLAMSVACGLDFLGFNVPKPRRVLYLQLEVAPKHFQERLQKMTNSIGIKKEELKGRLFISNLRGVQEDMLKEEKYISTAQNVNADLIVIDPTYLIMGDENDQEVAKGLVKMLQRIVTATRASLIAVFHATKSNVTNASRDAVDMASGSSVYGRATDAVFSLGRHKEDGLTIVSVRSRNYKTPEDFTIERKNGVFSKRDDIKPLPWNPQTKAKEQEKQEKQEKQISAQDVAEWFRESGESGVINMSTLQACLADMGFSIREAKAKIPKLLKSKLIVEVKGKANARAFKVGEDVMKVMQIADASDIPKTQETSE